MIKFLTDIFIDKQGKPLPYIKKIKRIDHLTIIRLKGNIDFNTIKEVSNNINDEIKDSFDKNILLDFKKVRNVDSSTLAYLITLLNQLQKQHRKLGIINVNVRLDSYLTIEGLDQLIHKYNNEKDALKDLLN